MAGRTPRIGRVTKQNEKAQLAMAEAPPAAVVVEEAAVVVKNIEDLKPSAEERALGSYDAIVAARQQFQDAYKAATPAEPAVPKTTPTPSLISKFIDRANAPTSEALLAEQAECDRVGRPMVTEAHSIQTAFGILRINYQPKVEAYVGTDWAALRAATPSVLIWCEKPGMLVDISKQAIHNFQVAVTNARTTLASTFGDAQPGPREVNAVSLQHAAQILGNLLDSGGNYIADKSLDGRSVRVQSATFKRAVVQMSWWLNKARSILESAQHAVERFVTTERELNEVLAQAGAPRRHRAAPEEAIPAGTGDAARQADQLVHRLRSA